MRPVFAALALFLFAALAVAQDKVTLSNGDVLTGSIKTFADGKLTITSPVLGDVTVPLSNVTSMTSAEPVELLTDRGELLKRKIDGIENGQLRLATAPEGSPGVPSLALANLAQINPPPKPPIKWTGSLKVNAGFTSGNTDRKHIGSAFDAVRRTDDDRISADAAWDYSEEKQAGVWNLTERRVGAGLKYDYFLSKRWYALVTTRVQGDTFADLSLRFTAGAGLGYQVLDTETASLQAEAGLSYFNENYISATPTREYLAARLAYKLKYAFSKTTRLLHSVEAFPSTERAEDVYFTMNTELQTNLTDSMIASLGWIWDYDNTPATGRDRSDNRVLLSVGWTF